MQKGPGYGNKPATMKMENQLLEIRRERLGERKHANQPRSIVRQL